MKTDADIVRGLLADHDPARDVRADAPERERTLEAILTEPPAVDSGRRGVHRRKPARVGATGPAESGRPEQRRPVRLR